MGRGKIERFFRTVRDQFLVEVAHAEVPSLEALEEYFVAWVEGVYHRRVHSETGQTPLERFAQHPPPAIPAPALVREAFLFAEARTVSKTATVSLHGNRYEVDGALAGRRVELVFDPFDLTDINVRYLDTDFGRAVPVVIGRHAHPQVRPDPQPTPPTGIDYLAVIERQHRQATGQPIGYAGLNADNSEDEEAAR